MAGRCGGVGAAQGMTDEVRGYCEQVRGGRAGAGVRQSAIVTAESVIVSVDGGWVAARRAIADPARAC